MDESDRPQAREEKDRPLSQPPAMSFTLRLPSTIRIHPVFRVSQLESKDPVLSRTVVTRRLPHLSSMDNPNI